MISKGFSHDSPPNLQIHVRQYFLWTNMGLVPSLYPCLRELYPQYQSQVGGIFPIYVFPLC